MLTHELRDYSSKIIDSGLYRRRDVFSHCDTKINFSSNDYLSLSLDSCLKKSYQHGFECFATGSGGSMLVCGYHASHQALEDAYKRALAVDDCLLFPSGYAANLSVIGLLSQLGAHLLIDKGVHASIYDGLRMSGAQYSRYLHNNLDDLTTKLQQGPRQSVIVTESIFSMSGQSAPLSAMAQLSRQYAQELFVDEAHAFGVVGEQGLGAVVQHQLTQQEVPLRIIPFGKSCAAFGAVVAGQGVWIDALLQSARPHRYSTALSPAVTYGLLHTLERIRQADSRRAKLFDLVRYFREACAKSPLPWRDASSPIQQLQLGCPHQALKVATTLREQGVIALPMRQPTVSKQETGLKIALNYCHEPEHIDYLFDCLHSILRV